MPAAEERKNGKAHISHRVLNPPFPCNLALPNNRDAL